jgi:hypothetical protein
MDVEMTGSPGSRGTTLGSVGLDTGNPLQALADAISEALGLSPEPGSGPAASVHAARGYAQLQAGA